MRQPLFPQRRSPKVLIGMVHLHPLPGSPRWQGSMQQLLDATTRDAFTLEQGGVDAVIVENYGDTPFYPGPVPPETVAAMTAAILDVARAISIPVGVNVLRNDATAALAICAATAASFIRVNVHTGAMLTDQGWISGGAHETLRFRSQLGIDVRILADVFVKHATAPAGLSIEDAASDTWERGHADGLIVSGSGTGKAASQDDVKRLHKALPHAPILIGSGLTTANAESLLQHADGAIVGSSLKTDGHAESPVALDRVRELVHAIALLKA